MHNPPNASPTPIHRCQAKRHSDQMVCHECGLVWDVNDPEPPACPQKAASSPDEPLQPGRDGPILRFAQEQEATVTDISDAAKRRAVSALRRAANALEAPGAYAKTGGMSFRMLPDGSMAIHFDLTVGFKSEGEST
jgi:hypothetical protein